MSTDWARVNDVFHRALAEPGGRRAAFLAEACAGDAALLAEVTSLLAAHERAGAFIETPAVRAVEPLTTSSPAGPSLAGSTIAHYVVKRVLGEGGMGVVYLAEDTRLGRLVALKAVAPRFTGDAGRRERLRREARAAAALTHSGIATVYALEEVGDDLYIASEYVPGETLREELARGPLPIPRVIDTGVALAHALATAHDRGFVHRDLKPENIIRLPDGSVKILDFGLARSTGESPSPLARLTEAGAILGTPAYMAPEQIRGDAVNARADQFALGLVLYELATGTHPLTGSDAVATIAKILETEPAPLATHVLPAPGVQELDALVMTCLQKDPRARFASTHAVVGALERARHALADANPQPARPATRTPSAAPDLAWWWTFHQAAAVIAYGALLVPLWWTREWTGGLAGVLIFLGGLVGAIAASTLRLHLWFILRSHPSDWLGQQARTRPWLRGADVWFVASLLAGSVAMLTTHAGVATILVASAVAVLLAATIIEPATTRAAFTPPA